MKRSALLAFGALMMSVVTMAGTPAHAQLGGASGIVIPYAGRLELNGALVTGSVDLQFAVLEEATTTTACQTQTLNAVPVTNGEFAVTIPAVDEACVKGKDVHLQVAVRQAGGSFVVLGRQRVTPVVGAVTSGPGDFAVAGALTASSAHVTDALTANNANVTGALTANNANVTGALTANIADVTGVLTASSVVVTSADDQPETNIAAFMAQDQTQGIGIGNGTIRATGSNADVSMTLTPKGSGSIVVEGPLRVVGPLGIGYSTRTCTDFGAFVISAGGFGFCGCPAGSVVLGGAIDCSSKGGVRETRVITTGATIAGTVVPDQSYAGSCNQTTFPFASNTPASVTVTCARLGP
jgi:hypothetical protein